MEVRITTTVVATTSFWLGQVTRPISLRTSERKRRERPHHPVTLSRARPPKESCSSAVIVFIADPCQEPGVTRQEAEGFAPTRSPCLLPPEFFFQHWQDRRESNP